MKLVTGVYNSLMAEHSPSNCIEKQRVLSRVSQEDVQVDMIYEESPKHYDASKHLIHINGQYS